MKDNNSNKKEKIAKKMAAGPLGKESSKYPLLYAKAAFFGERPSRDRPTVIQNGTIGFVDLGNGPLGITCQHVIQGYRIYREKYDDVLFNIGNVELDPLSQLIDENDKIDLATIRLTEKQIGAITSQGEIGSCVYKPRSWPPSPPKENEFVAFGGFPSNLRKIDTFDEIGFYSWSSGGSRIDSVNEFRFISPFEREYWIRSFGKLHLIDLKALGGMSGSPAFIFRELFYEFVGVLSDYEENYDAVFFATVQSIKPDGTIEPPPV